ncbi:MAG: hypothetical protein H0V01_15750 [Bacteroidetes bacterium]|nr:hypothetical protein [Bacteroidota bacterium]HET6245282.1 hypothetical protein [Bacteroidia bacterium]
MKKTNYFKIAAFSAVFILASQGVFSQERTASRSESKGDVKIEDRLAYTSDDEVKQFMKEVIASDLPADYKVPAYVKNAKSMQDASKAVGAYFPEFYGKYSNELLLAIRRNPARYKQMMFDSKAIRNQFPLN